MRKIKPKTKCRQFKCFTLIEILIVIAIIGILASVILVMLSGAKDKAKAKAAFQTMDAVRAIIQECMIFDQPGTIPCADTAQGGGPICCKKNPDGTLNCDPNLGEYPSNPQIQDPWVYPTSGPLIGSDYCYINADYFDAYFYFIYNKDSLPSGVDSPYCTDMAQVTALHSGEYIFCTNMKYNWNWWNTGHITFPSDSPYGIPSGDKAEHCKLGRIETDCDNSTFKAE